MYEDFLQSVNNEEGRTYFPDAPGGTGKTFLINLLLSKVRGQQSVAIAATSSGITATLLPNGRTAHALFNLPLDLAKTDEASCTISRASSKANVLKKAKLIVWDECAMAHKLVLSRWTEPFRTSCKMGLLWVEPLCFSLGTSVKLYLSFQEEAKQMKLMHASSQVHSGTE